MEQPSQRILPILPLSGRHHRYRPQGQGRRPKDLGPVPGLGRRRDVLHRARRAIRRHHRRRRHRQPILEECPIGNSIPPGRPTEIVRDAFLFATPTAVVGSGGKAALKAAEVEGGGVIIYASFGSEIVVGIVVLNNLFYFEWKGSGLCE